MKKNILIFGAGYVGFSLAVVLARTNNVKVLDIREDVIDLINDGKSPIIDAGIVDALDQANRLGNLQAASYCETSVHEADFIILALPTNFNAELNCFETSILEDVLKRVARIDRLKPIIIKSTIPVGFTKEVIEKFNLENCFYSPEFLREGRAIYDNLHPTRIIIGASHDAARSFGALLEEVAQIRSVRTIYTDSTTAEITKLASNSYLATRVAFFNEVDSLALKLNLKSGDLIDGICADPRIGTGYNNPSFGYGGYCLPKDVQQFQSSMEKFKVEAPLIGAIHKSNKQRIHEIASIVIGSGCNKVGIYRAQMKQGSDNARESVSLALLDILRCEPALQIQIFEPGIKLAKELEQFLVTDFKNFTSWAELILANRDAIELQPFKHKVITRDIYNEN